MQSYLKEQLTPEKKFTVFLDCYNRWMEAGKLPDKGLCNSLKHETTPEQYQIFNSLNPCDEDWNELLKSNYSMVYWASELHQCDWNRQQSFNELRQNIVLFCAAINNEL